MQSVVCGVTGYCIGSPAALGILAIISFQLFVIWKVVKQ